MERFIGISKWNLDTPCLVLDLDLFNKNVNWMQEFITKNGKKVRPHAKTHKCSKIAHKQIEAGAIGISVAKLSEAQVLLEKGIKNILITSAISSPFKLKSLVKSQYDFPESEIIVVVDCIENIQQLNEANNQYAFENIKTIKKFKVLIDIDGGHHRTGTTVEQAPILAKFISDSMPALTFCGIQCYIGNVQHVHEFEMRKKISLTALNKVSEAVTTIRNELSISCEIYTGGGTGTHDIDIGCDALTDIQVGSYIMLDMEYGNIETKSEIFTRVPLSLISRVVSNQQLPHQVTIDAGLKALYKDGGIPKLIAPKTNLDIKYDWYGDEHGKLTIKHESSYDINSLKEQFAIGTAVELRVSHVDPTVNLFDWLYIVQNDVVVDVWPIDLRGKSQ